ncbi:MAG: LAGLIDADG family homing endonuclease, partial [Candidatus Diapherotrites archaeon]|nr:LAGLIDADG family homing endonuclease [Candidatus Diapherotrites archaeon]
KEITDKLIQKHGSVQNIAKNIGVSRDLLYLWRTENFSSGIPLNAFVKLGLEAGYSFEELSHHVKEIFLSYGKNIKIPKNIDNEEIAYLAGLVLGDGNIYLTKNSAATRIFNQSEQILQEVDRIVSKNFGIKTEKINDGIRVPNRRIASIPLYLILNSYGIVKEKNKIKISCVASEFSNKIVSKILQGLFDTDGYTAKTKKGSSHVGLSTISTDLAKTIQLSLLKFGIHAKLRLRKKAGAIAVGKNITVKSNHDQYYIEIRGKENLEKFQSQINFNLERKKDSLKEIIDSIPKSNTNIDVIPEIKNSLEDLPRTGYVRNTAKNISRNKLTELVEKYKSKTKNEFLELLSNSDIFWEPITEKTEFKPAYEYVYDFSVKDSHNFIA